MAHSVQVIAGPAASGKTTRLLGLYRERLTNAAGGACLWLAPTHRAASVVRRRLLSGSLAGFLEPGVVTFEQFADSLVAKSHDINRPIDRLVQRRVLVHLIHRELNANRLKYFRKVAENGSLVELALDWIIELKRLEVWPDQFEEACAKRGLEARDRELVELYRGYQAHLVSHGLYDAEGRVWSARSYLQQRGAECLGNLQLVVADGFADFTRTQHEILQSLADPKRFANSQLYVSLPLEPSTHRQHLFHKSTATLAQLAAHHERVDIDYIDRPARNTDVSTRLSPALTHIERQLFASPADQSSLDDPTGVEIVAASSDLGEIETIARRIKRLLLDGDGGQHVAPQQIGVVFRSVAPSANLIREVFEEFGIPYSLETPRRLGDAPVMRAVMALLELAVEDWPFRALLGVFNSNYFNLVDSESNTVRRSAERLIRHLQIPKSRRKLLEQTDRLREISIDDAADSKRLEHYIRWANDAYPLLSQLAEALDALPSRATLGQWHAALIELVARLGMVDMLESETPAVDPKLDQTAWQRLAELIDLSCKAEDWTGESLEHLDLAGFIHALADLCRNENLPSSKDDVGRVRVLSAPGVRGTTFDYLFVAGLSEKSFPSLARQEALYSEEDYRQLRKRGLPLADHTERSRDEMLLFYEVITRATRRLWLTYPAIDEGGQPLCPSPYVTEVERACGDGRLVHHREIHLSPVPQVSAPLGNDEWRLLAASSAMDRNVPDARLLAAHGKEQTRSGPHSNLLAGLHVVAERQTGEGFGPYEGVMLDSHAPEILLRQFGPEKLWSATELEQYALCPHRFFLEHVLKIEEPEELSLELDYGARGRALHETLTRAHRYLNERAGEPLSPSQLDHAERTALEAHLLELLRDTIAALPAGSDVDRALLEVNRREIEKWVLAYVDQHQAYDELQEKLADVPPRPAHFEVAFGTKPRDGDDPRRSTHAPLEITLAGEQLKIAGRVDRIDVGHIAGRAVFNIIDYKTSKRSPGKSEFDGTALQLDLYAIATEELLLADEHALPWRAGYWMVRERGFHRPLEMGEFDEYEGLRQSQAWLDRRTKLLDRITSIVHGIRQGHFPMYSADDHCTSNCPYRTVCRVNQTRNLEKQWDV
ncbi:MAG: PD-(D/E)XK nuclease family protein [Pirellulales bacterium]|nr:PD-(D/E)XK nuclease family protein [Pirellulales bacterium]